MAITVNGAILRNMPEQISKNVEDIADLQTTSENHETRIAALEAGAIALATFQDCTFTGTTTISGTAFNVSAPATFTAGLTSNTVTAATVTATSLVAGSSTISGDETVSGNLAVTGNITGGSIIENMSGYSASLATNTGYTIENVYTSACKNGNKITFVTAVNITKTDANASASIQIATFNIPAAISAKLYPVNVGGSNFLDNKVIKAFSDFLTSVDVTSAYTKGTNLAFVVANTANMVVNTKYYYRYEATFLLNDSLI